MKTIFILTVAIITSSAKADFKKECLNGSTSTKFTTVTTMAGSGTPGSSDGTGTSSLLNKPHGLGQGKSGLIYFADRGNHQIRSFNTKTLEVRTIAGSGTVGFADLNGHQAQFAQPIAVTISKSGVVYVADRDNHRIRKIDLEGNVSTLAGTGVAGFSNGERLTAQFNQPYGVALDQSERNLMVADYLNHSIRKINLTSGAVTTVAGNGSLGNVDGQGSEARFHQPYNIKHDGFGNFYIPDQNNHSIRLLNSYGKVTTIAGNGKAGYLDAKGTEAQFNNPTGLAVHAGHIFVADRNNHRIRMISLDRTVTTLTGTGTEGDNDGSLDQAEFKRPIDLVYDSKTKTLYLSEENGHRIRKIQ